MPTTTWKMNGSIRYPSHCQTKELSIMSDDPKMCPACYAEAMLIKIELVDIPGTTEQFKKRTYACTVPSCGWQGDNVFKGWY